jgi:hypothetical protein
MSLQKLWSVLFQMALVAAGSRNVCFYIQTYIHTYIHTYIRSPTSYQGYNNRKSAVRGKQYYKQRRLKYWIFLTSRYFIPNISQGHFLLSIPHDVFITSTSDIRPPIHRPCVYVGAWVVYCPAQQFLTIKINLIFILKNRVRSLRLFWFVWLSGVHFSIWW